MKNKKFEEYFMTYKNLVIRMVVDKTGDYQAAQEICQQVFVSLYTNMEKVTPELVKAWIIRCTQNAIVDHLRHRKVHGEIFAETSVAEAGNILMEENLDVCEERLDNRELTGRIMREVRQVNEQWYEVLMACCVEGLSYEEAAKKLRIPAAMLRARMYRARMFIREKYGDEYRK